MRNYPAAFFAREWQSEDGLRLHYRDYPGGDPDRPPLLCLHGLTRNSRDFEMLADRFAGEWRLIVPDMRGRGRSEYAPGTYALHRYVRDVTQLLMAIEAGPVAIVGTSMGGLIALHMAARDVWPIAGVLLNDIGPEIEPAGLARILEYVGQGGSFETWMHAARHLREMSGAAHPRFELADWLAMAKRVMSINPGGRIVFDYDMRIAEPPPEPAEPVDLWQAWRALAGRPTMVVRGELSDILSQATVDRMVKEVGGAEAVNVPGVGHPPTLAEPEAEEAVTRWLERLA
jgi:pimeloyl-ACP methyl ester carboxylesterase